MTHRRRRVSRVLLAVLALTITVGLFTYVHKLNSSKAAASGGSKLASAGASSGQPIITTAAEAIAPTTGGADEAAASPTQPPAGSSKTSALVTETPSASSLPAEPATPPGGVMVVATAARPHGFGGATAPAASSPGAEKVSAAPAASQKVSIQPYTAPAGGSVANVAPGSAVAQGRAHLQAGKLLEARDVVNAALASGRLSAADAAAARQLLAEVSQTVVFSSRRFADDKWGGTYSVQSGDRLDRIGAKFGVTPALLMKLNGITDARRLRAGATIKVLKGPFHAVVNKNAFRLDLYLGAPGGPDSAYVTSYPVALGKDNSTPEGKWVVEPQKKLKNPEYYSPRGEGVIQADDPRNPLGDYWIGLAGTDGDAVGKQSYGIHGTIDPDSIGKQASMGCVRMRNEDVAVVFDALVEGKSTVLVVD